MKKLLVIASVALFAACGKGPVEPQPPKESYWRTTHEYFCQTLEDSHLYPEKLVEAINVERSVEVSEEESYQLTFREDGTGSGSGVRLDGEGRFNFKFTWELSEDKPQGWTTPASPDATWISMTEIGDGYGGIFLTSALSALENAVWEVEEYTDDRMVLSSQHLLLVDGSGEFLDRAWEQTLVYRYTFEKVK